MKDLSSFVKLKKLNILPSPVPPMPTSPSKPAVGGRPQKVGSAIHRGRPPIEGEGGSWSDEPESAGSGASRMACKELNMPMAAAVDVPASPWASLLLPDLVSLIGWRVLAGDLLDYVRFRAVCPLWRSSTVCPRGRGLVDARFYPRHWMLLTEGLSLCPGHTQLRGYVRFFNISTGFFVRARLPIFEDQYILDFVHGLVLLLREEDNTVRLLNPFTKDIADLPSLATLMNHSLSTSNFARLREIRATSVSVNPDGLITVMILLQIEYRVAFATSGRDHQWSLSTWALSSIRSAVSFKGSLYVFSVKCRRDRQVFQIDPPQLKEIGVGLSSPSPPKLKLVATCPDTIGHPYHLVECGSDILVAGSCGSKDSLKMSVYRLSDLVMEKIFPVTCIGGTILFANMQKSLIVSGRALPAVAADTIVTTFAGKRNLGKYHLKSGTWSLDDCTIERGFEPSPRSLIHRIFWSHYGCNWEKDYSFRWDVEPRLVKRNWRDEDMRLHT